MHTGHLSSHSIIQCCWTPRARPDEQTPKQRGKNTVREIPIAISPSTPLANVTAPPTFPPPARGVETTSRHFVCAERVKEAGATEKKPLGRRSLRLWAPPAAQRLRPLGSTRDKTQPGDYRKTTEGDYRFSRVKIKERIGFSYLLFKRNVEAEEGSTFKRRETHRRKRKITALKTSTAPVVTKWWKRTKLHRRVPADDTKSGKNCRNCAEEGRNLKGMNAQGGSQHHKAYERGLRTPRFWGVQLAISPGSADASDPTYYWSPTRFGLIYLRPTAVSISYCSFPRCTASSPCSDKKFWFTWFVSALKYTHIHWASVYNFTWFSFFGLCAHKLHICKGTSCTCGPFNIHF